MSRTEVLADRNTKVFISYSRKDRAFVARLSEALETQDDIEVFRDTEDILPTEEWKHRLEQLIGEADTIVFALSPHSAASEVCSWEVDYAESLNKRIAPIVIRNVAATKIPKALTRYNYIFFTAKDDFDKALTNLVRALNTDIDWIREHTRLGELARRWDAQRKLGAQPLRAKELMAAEDWLARQPENAPPPTALHREYVTHSRRTATRRQQFWVSGSLAAAIMMATLAGFAYLQKQEADTQRNLALEQRSIAVTNGKLAKENEKQAIEERERAETEKLRAERNLERALSAADTLVVEIAGGMKDFKGVPIERIRSVLEKAEAVLKGLGGAGGSNAVRHRQAIMLHSFVDAYETLGDLEEASKRAASAVDITAALAAQDPGNAEWQRNLSVSYDRAGDVQVAQGNLTGALKSYRDGLVIRERLAASDPANTDWQRDLTVSYNKIGSVQKAQGDLTSALASFRDGLVIRERLAASDPANTDWQNDLSVSYVRVGDVQTAQIDLTSALASYRDSLVIGQRLAESDPTNAVLQRDLAVAYARIGNVQKAQTDLTSALASYRHGLAIMERLAASDPGNADWQRDLAVLHNKAGDVQKTQDDLASALASYRASLVISERLAASDPTNAGWQRDLAASYNKVGEAQRTLGDLTSAASSYRDGLVIRERLAASDPTNAGWQRDLSVSYELVGLVMEIRGDLSGAVTSYRSSLAISERLAASDRKNLSWQKDLAWLLEKFGTLLVKMHRDEEALEVFKRGRALVAPISKHSRNFLWMNYLATFDVNISRLEK